MSISSPVEKYPPTSASMQHSQTGTRSIVSTIQDKEGYYRRLKAEISDLSGKQKDVKIPLVKDLRRETCPNGVGTLAKMREYLLFASSELWVRRQDGLQQFKALSTNARFSHYVVDPFYCWFGMNDRVVITAGLGKIGLQNSLGQEDNCISKSSAKMIFFFEYIA
jgi:hypothetical protein